MDAKYVEHAKTVLKKLRQDLGTTYHLIDMHGITILADNHADDFTRARFEFELATARMYMEEAFKMLDDCIENN